MLLKELSAFCAIAFQKELHTPCAFKTKMSVLGEKRVFKSLRYMNAMLAFEYKKSEEFKRVENCYARCGAFIHGKRLSRGPQSVSR